MITGSNNGKYEDRGIIPRSFEVLFREIDVKKNQAILNDSGDDRKNYNRLVSFDVTCEYVEVHNEQAYDLLGREDLNESLVAVQKNNRERSEEGNNPVEYEELSDVLASLHEGEKQQLQTQFHLPRVYLQEDDKKTFHLKGISTHKSRTEEDAMNLLFTDDANRAVAETPMNMASSQAHCIFTITVEKHTSGDDTLQRAKLNIVDLVGSERVSKTKIDVSVLTEAKHIFALSGTSHCRFAGAATMQT